MAFKEVSSLDADITIAIGKVNKETGKPYPKQAEGYYLGSRKVENKRGESTLHFLTFGSDNPAVVREFKALGLGIGQNLGVWGTTDLNRKLGAAPVGAMVRVTSTGTKATPNGDMYTYKVEVDSDNSIEVAASDSAQESFDDLDESEDTNSFEEEVPYQSNIAATSGRSVEDVKRLLAKNKRN